MTVTEKKEYYLVDDFLKLKLSEILEASNESLNWFVNFKF